MIMIGSVGSVKDVNKAVNIARGNMRDIKEKIISFAPSERLFKLYQKKKLFSVWNETEFQTWYRPLFLMEHALDWKQGTFKSDFMKVINHKEDITFVCFCPNELTCHRSIICGLVQFVAAKTDKYELVVWNTDFRCYGREFQYYLSLPDKELHERIKAFYCNYE